MKITKSDAKYVIYVDGFSQVICGGKGEAEAIAEKLRNLLGRNANVKICICTVEKDKITIIPTIKGEPDL